MQKCRSITRWTLGVPGSPLCRKWNDNKPKVARLQHWTLSTISFGDFSTAPAPNSCRIGDLLTFSAEFLAPGCRTVTTPAGAYKSQHLTHACRAPLQPKPKLISPSVRSPLPKGALDVSRVIAWQQSKQCLKMSEPSLCPMQSIQQDMGCYHKVV